jgi:hypothetical protein
MKVRRRTRPKQEKEEEGKK